MQHHEIRVQTAPFWLRTVALVIDLLPLLTIYLMVLLGTGLVSTADMPQSRWNTFDMLVDLINQRPLFFLPPILLLFGMVLAYYLVQELLFGQTVGKRLLNLVIVDRYGHRPEAVMVLVRNLTRIFSMALFGWGYLWAAFDTERRATHDWISGCFVVSRTSEVPRPR